MRKYAQDTSVPADRTRNEIEALLRRHGSTGFVYGNTDSQVMIGFQMKERRLRFLVPMLVLNQRRSNEREVAKEERRRWRALLLLIKAKLESVASGIVAFDHEFLAHIVIDGNTTVGDHWVPEAQMILGDKGHKLPPLLGAGS